MREDVERLAQRLLEFAAAVVRLVGLLPILQEAEELCRIIAKSVITTKQGK